MIALIDYNGGNTLSVQNALNRLGYKSIVTANIEEIQKADKVIFPGVGEASSAMKSLEDKGINECLQSLIQPVLGICLGMQLMCKSSEEGNTKGLGIFNTEVKRFPNSLKVPHMGWNSLEQVDSLLCKGIEPNEDFYFVHSYYAEQNEKSTGLCNYILPFAAILEKDNFYGVQFHPEKSGKAGAQVLQNFLKL
jgi:imidazole glycerol-phosphate synthase subunit HisH